MPLHAVTRDAAQAGSPLPQFEVASVKQNTSGAGKAGISTMPDGRFTAENTTLRALVLFAYGLQPLQLIGGPSWFDSDRFDIVAKGDGRTQLMLRALLAERFKLEVHGENKELPVYALVLARSDGKLGPQIRSSQLDCASMTAKPSSLPPVKAAQMTSCGIRNGPAPGSMIVGGASMAQIANSLTAWVDRMVVDRTGLIGNFDFTLGWTPDQMPQGFGQKVAADGLAPPDPNGPSIFTAVQEQLGLKLDSRKTPVDILIVDGAEHPTEN